MHSVAPGTEIREYSIAANRSTKELTKKITEDTQNFNLKLKLPPSQAQDILRGERPSLRMKKITPCRHLGCTIVPESRGIGIRDHRAGRSPGYDWRIGLERGGNQHERLKVKSRQCGRRVRRLGVKAGGLDPKDGNG